MPRAIFLDMDDTILDSSGGVEESWGLVCREFAGVLCCEPEPLRLAIRESAREFWKDEAISGHWRVRLEESRVLYIEQALRVAKLDHGQARAIADRYDAEVTARYRLFDDAVETLEWLRDQGFGLSLLTNGPRGMQRAKIERFGLARYFDAIYIEGEFGHGKPSREVFEHALATSKAAAADAWHVGDNLYADIGGAQGAGIHAVWIHRERLELKDDAPAVPDRVIGHLSELRAALDE
jgi:putative hydrolase of the HAD superfamily